MDQTNTYSNVSVTEAKVDAVAISSKRQVRITSFTCFNSGGAASYVQFFDALAADVVLGTTVPKWVLPLPASGGVDGPSGPLVFSAGVCIAVTATPGGAGAPAAGALVQFCYV